MQVPLIHEDFLDALKTCVQALGGAKKVGPMLRPEWEDEPDKASRWLLACLNSSRDERLTYEQTFKVMREAKKIGCHSAMFYITQLVGYSEPMPIDPEDEKAKLQREFIAASKVMEQIAARLGTIA
jgi:hypothetical protein